MSRRLRFAPSMKLPNCRKNCRMPSPAESRLGVRMDTGWEPIPEVRTFRRAETPGTTKRHVWEALCPEGAIGLSPGFQPWEGLSKGICPEGARDHGSTDGWHYACDLDPFRALPWGDTVPRVEWREMFGRFNARRKGLSPGGKIRS
jgi:hypothetical protein